MMEVALIEPWMKAAKKKKKTKKIEEQGLYIGKENKRKERKERKPEIAIKLPKNCQKIARNRNVPPVGFNRPMYLYFSFFI